jgi:hypothetical protein
VNVEINATNSSTRCAGATNHCNLLNTSGVTLCREAANILERGYIMETTIRFTTIACSIALVFLAAVDAPAQEQTRQGDWEYAADTSYLRADCRRLERPYLESLSFPIEGVIECALREVARVKIAHLEWESPALLERLDELVRGGTSEAICCKASLVRMLFENPALFRNDSKIDYRTPGELYRAIARRLETTLLAGR